MRNQIQHGLRPHVDISAEGREYFNVMLDIFIPCLICTAPARSKRYKQSHMSVADLTSRNADGCFMSIVCTSRDAGCYNNVFSNNSERLLACQTRP